MNENMVPTLEEQCESEYVKNYKVANILTEEQFNQRLKESKRDEPHYRLFMGVLSFITFIAILVVIADVLCVMGQENIIPFSIDANILFLIVIPLSIIEVGTIAIAFICYLMADRLYEDKMLNHIRQAQL